MFENEMINQMESDDREVTGYLFEPVTPQVQLTLSICSVERRSRNYSPVQAKPLPPMRTARCLPNHTHTHTHTHSAKVQHKPRKWKTGAMAPLRLPDTEHGHRKIIQAQVLRLSWC